MTNKEMKITLKLILKWCILIAIFLCLWIAFTPLFRVDRVKKGDERQNIPHDILDIISIGSSQIEYGINPAVLFTEENYYAYSMTSPLLPFELNEYMLEEALKTQSPEVAVFDVFTLLPTSQVDYEFELYYRAMQQLTGTTRKKAANAVTNSSIAQEYSYDLLMNHKNWKYMNFSHPSSILSNAVHSSKIDPNFGYYYEHGSSDEFIPLVTSSTQEVTPISTKAKANIDSLLRLCEKNGITPIFIKTPSVLQEKDFEVLQGIWNYLDQLGIRYIDYVSLAQSLNWGQGMDGDAWHCNIWGAEIVSSHLANYIKENQLVSHHEDSSWFHDSIQSSQKELLNALIKDEIDPYKLFDYAHKYPCTLVVKYTYDETQQYGEYENQLMNDAGIHMDFISSTEPYYAIIQNGVVLQESSTPFSSTIGDKTIELREDAIVVDGSFVTSEPSSYEVLFMDNEATWRNSLTLNSSSSGFWKKGCNGYSCN